MRTKLAELIKEKNKTQQEMADYLGISQASFNAYISGKSEPDLIKIIKLADYFGCSVDYLLGHQTTNILQLDLLTETQKELFEKIKVLSDRDANRVIGYIGRLEGEKFGNMIDKIMQDKKPE